MLIVAVNILGLVLAWLYREPPYLRLVTVLVGADGSAAVVRVDQVDEWRGLAVPPDALRKSMSGGEQPRLWMNIDGHLKNRGVRLTAADVPKLRTCCSAIPLSVGFDAEPIMEFDDALPVLEELIETGVPLFLRVHTPHGCSRNPPLAGLEAFERRLIAECRAMPGDDGEPRVAVRIVAEPGAMYDQVMRAVWLARNADVWRIGFARAISDAGALGEIGPTWNADSEHDARLFQSIIVHDIGACPAELTAPETSPPTRNRERRGISITR
jgi:hypothetical protein